MARLTAGEKTKEVKQENGLPAKDSTRDQRDTEAMDAMDTQRDEQACEAQLYIPGRGHLQQDLK